MIGGGRWGGFLFPVFLGTLGFPLWGLEYSLVMIIPALSRKRGDGTNLGTQIGDFTTTDTPYLIFVSLARFSRQRALKSF